MRYSVGHLSQILQQTGLASCHTPRNSVYLLLHLRVRVDTFVLLLGRILVPFDVVYLR
jgi:hypothetical protein